MKILSEKSISSVDADHWQHFPVRALEDCRNLVLGADIEAVQMAGGKIGGSLVFTAHDGVVFSSGQIDGSIAARGVISHDAVTLWIVLSPGNGFRVGLRRVQEGAVGVALPGYEFDALYAPGAMYVAATLELARFEYAVCRKFRQSAIHPKSLDTRRLEELKTALLRIHAGDEAVAGFNIGTAVLRAATSHYTNHIGSNDKRRPSSYETIVGLARNYIERHLTEPISIEDVTTACGSSRRTLYRAFLGILGETPLHYIRRLRLHRIRRDLLSGGQRETISASARKWGISEPGRMSGWYQEIFGEKPSATLATRHKRQVLETWL